MRSVTSSSPPPSWPERTARAAEAASVAYATPSVRRLSHRSQEVSVVGAIGDTLPHRPPGHSQRNVRAATAPATTVMIAITSSGATANGAPSQASRMPWTPGGMNSPMSLRTSGSSHCGR